MRSCYLSNIPSQVHWFILSSLNFYGPNLLLIYLSLSYLVNKVFLEICRLIDWDWWEVIMLFLCFWFWLQFWILHNSNVWIMKVGRAICQGLVSSCLLEFCWLVTECLLFALLVLRVRLSLILLLMRLVD